MLKRKKLTNFAFWMAVKASPGGGVHKVITVEASPGGYFTSIYRSNMYKTWLKLQVCTCVFQLFR